MSAMGEDYGRGGFQDDFAWDDMGPGPMYGFDDPRNSRYQNAYGNYRGGYSRGRGFGHPFMPNGPFMGPPQPGPPFVFGRGFGPNGPPVQRFPMKNRVIKYLTRCGVPKENLRNLPGDLLRLIEPQYCGLCGQVFDNYGVSRIHYTSKNHLKNQRKYLVQRHNIQRTREPPMKSRDLYCELCDVQITSKNHADSHYSGKIHRAIVEGRKMPKNPMLVQRGMENRVEQLIRREKKCLKADESEVVQDPKELKAVPPELYCDICKTSVTCSEQMTMHLNGKRHLTKEKQHILKMMKGDADNNAQKEAAAATETAPAEVSDEQKQAQETTAKDNNDDWENSGEKWEENATQ